VHWLNLFAKFSVTERAAGHVTLRLGLSLDLTSWTGQPRQGWYLGHHIKTD